MRTIQTILELRNALGSLRQQSRTIGFVPTMGALHEGHLSLIRRSNQNCDVTVVSIFVNPTQFGPNEDYSRYPRTLDEDTRKLVDEDVDFLFLPSAVQMYPEGHSTVIHVGEVTERLEGAIRPGHFDGVATVVASLLNIVQPTIAFFGQKDAQQVAVVKRMVRDLHLPVEIQVGTTVRESGKLALSSRNRFLTDGDLDYSNSLSETLAFVKTCLLNGDPPESAVSQGKMLFRQISGSATLDYLEIVDSETFSPLTSFEAEIGKVSGIGDISATIVIAARFGEIRLIDNMPIESSDTVGKVSAGASEKTSRGTS